MNPPEFTRDEAFAIAALTSPTYSMFGSTYTWGYLISGCILFGFGLYDREFGPMIAGFVVLAAFRLYEMYYEHRWTKVWVSVVAKYEAAIGGEPASR